MPDLALAWANRRIWKCFLAGPPRPLNLERKHIGFRYQSLGLFGTFVSGFEYEKKFNESVFWAKTKEK